MHVYKSIKRVKFNTSLKYVNYRILNTQKTRKRKLDNLVTAETVDGGWLREAAKKNDESILTHIKQR